MKRKSLLILLMVVASCVGVGAFAIQQFGIIQPREPEIVDVYLSWGKITYEETELNAHVILYNPNKIGISVKLEELEIYFNDVELAWSKEVIEINLKPEKESTVSATLVIDNTKFQYVFVSHLQRGEESTIRVDVKLTILRLPISIEKPVVTDLLGEFEKATG